jgi:hypothetical protein
MPKKPNKQNNLTRQDIERAHVARHIGHLLFFQSLFWAEFFAVAEVLNRNQDFSIREKCGGRKDTAFRSSDPHPH